EVNLLAWLQNPGSREPLTLAQRAFDEALALDPKQAKSLVGSAVLAVLRDAPDDALRFGARAHEVDARAFAELEPLLPRVPALAEAFARNHLTLANGQLLRPAH